MSALTMDKLVALCKGRGFIYPGSEIYGGLANSWDLRPPGRGAQEQRQARLVAEIRAGEQI